VTLSLSTRMSTPAGLPDMQPEAATWSAVVPATGIAALGAATIAGAWFFQLVLDIRPCPLCLEQRYAYYFAIPIALVTAALARRGAAPVVLKALFAILGLALVANAALGAYHAGVEWGLWQGPTDCTGPIGDLGNASSLLERLQTEKVVRCDEVQWRFLGLSLAGYNVLISLVMAALAVWGLTRSRAQASAG
jgi:disulfide bond formation protein DsbB